MVALTTGCFIITWVPFLIASNWYFYCDPSETPDLCDNLRVAIAAPLSILGFANSFCNPIIYAWWHTGFRESIKKIYYQLLCRDRPSCLCCGSYGSKRNESFSSNKRTLNRKLTGKFIGSTLPSNDGSLHASNDYFINIPMTEKKLSTATVTTQVPLTPPTTSSRSTSYNHLPNSQQIVT